MLPKRARGQLPRGQGAATQGEQDQLARGAGGLLHKGISFRYTGTVLCYREGLEAVTQGDHWAKQGIRF
jgi:hypothetical protein